jgi:hypothetical protein
VNTDIEKFVEEIQNIDKQAFKMAVLVLKNPVLRHSLTNQATVICDRLQIIADALKSIDPKAYQEWSDQISESILDLSFVETELDIVSLRLGQVIEKERLRDQKNETHHNTFFPLPENIKNFTKTLKSDLISFQTNMSLEEIGKFYRDSLTQQGLIEHGLVTNMSEEHLSLVFLGLFDDRIAVVQAIDLGYCTDQDLRHVSLRTEKRPSHIPSDSQQSEEGKRIKLVEEQKETFTYIYVEVIGTGDLLMAGTRAGEAPRKFFNRDHLGYWILVAHGQKERVLKGLIEKIYGKDAFMNPEFLTVLEKKGDFQDDETRDRFLLRHIEKLYKGNPLAVQDFMER